jgi:uncharacterized membrane protein
MAKKEKTPGARSLEDEVRSNVVEVARIEQIQRKNRTAGERISEVIARFCGSMTFVWIHVAWFGTWIMLNSVLGFRFDPFPFTFLTLVVSLEAIFLSTFILIAQNQETRMTERRNQLDLQINLLAEKENTKMIELMAAIAEKVGVPVEDDSLKALEEPTDAKKVVGEIAHLIEGDRSELEPKDLK